VAGGRRCGGGLLWPSKVRGVTAPDGSPFSRDRGGPRGRPSTAPRHMPCLICLEDVGEGLEFRIRSRLCRHVMCRSCATTFVQSCIQTRRDSGRHIYCPEPTCTRLFAAADIRDALGDEAMDELLRATRDHIPMYSEGADRVEGAGDDTAHTMQCRRCKHGVVREKGCHKVECVCGNLFCFKCVQGHAHLRLPSPCTAPRPASAPPPYFSTSYPGLA